MSGELSSGNDHPGTDDRPTDPAPAVHCYRAPKFPPDPKAPSFEEPSMTDAHREGQSPGFVLSKPAAFRSAQVLRHLYPGL